MKKHLRLFVFLLLPILGFGCGGSGGNGGEQDDDSLLSAEDYKPSQKNLRR